MINFRFVRSVIFLVFLIFFIFSCKKDKNKGIIEKDEFVKILTEMYVEEGIMTDKGWYDAAMTDSSKSYYNFILRKYNLTRSKLDNSWAYYTRNLEDLVGIYDEVILELNKRVPKLMNNKSIYRIIAKSIEEAEMKLNPIKRFTEFGIELWMQKNVYNFPGDTLKTEVKVEREINHKCLLVLKADYQVMPQDKSKHLKMKLIVFYQDSTSDTVQKLIKIKNGKWENYHLALKTDSNKLPIKVESSAFSADSVNLQTFVYLRNISLRQYAPNQDTSKFFITPPKEIKQKPKLKNNKVINALP